MKRSASFINASKWIQNKKTTINSKNTKDNCCFAHAIVAARHHEETGKNPQRISNIAPFVNNYSWKDITFPSGLIDLKFFERNNKKVALNVLCIEPDKKELYTSYRSKFNKEREKQAIILMINENENEELEDNKYHYIAVKNLARLCRNVTSNHNGDVYCLNYLHSFHSKKSLQVHEKICHKHDHYQIIMPKE